MKNKSFVLNKIKYDECTGCEACTNACPTNSIKMVPNSEGFYYPQCDIDHCINCGLCSKVCPVVNVSEKNLLLKSYAGYATDSSIVNKSASGGMFGLLMDTFLKKNNNQKIISGVAWSDNFCETKHVICNNFEIDRLRSSKYIQSRKDNIYSIIKNKLDNGYEVLFSGTPCEIAGLKGVLGKEYDRLYTIDIVCQGPTSPKAMKEFINNVTKKGKYKISTLNMRYVKVEPWIPQWIKIEFDNKKDYCHLFYETPIGRAMHIMQRESCYRCSFNGNRRCSDITIGDFHKADCKRDYYNGKGTSIIIINTEKGMKLFKSIDEKTLIVEKVDYNEICKRNPRLISPTVKHPFRDKYSKIFIEKGLSCAFKASMSLRQKIRIRIPYNIRLKVRKIKNKGDN